MMRPYRFLLRKAAAGGTVYVIHPTTWECTALSTTGGGSIPSAGTNGNYGLEEGDYVGLPTATESWNFKKFTVDEYNAVVAKIRSGEIKVDNSSDDATKPATSDKLKVDYQV